MCIFIHRYLHKDVDPHVPIYVYGHTYTYLLLSSHPLLFYLLSVRCFDVRETGERVKKGVRWYSHINCHFMCSDYSLSYLFSRRLDDKWRDPVSLVEGKRM